MPVEEDDTPTDGILIQHKVDMLEHENMVLKVQLLNLTKALAEVVALYVTEGRQ
jgi:hypothetical protein